VAKDETLWVVKYSDEVSWYAVYYGGGRPLDEAEKKKHYVCQRIFEHLVPRRLWPKPGGPPVKVEFK
jgi:hypothetical protein